MVERRIQRQTLIEGWDQEKLDDSLFVAIGEGLASKYAALLASCIEFGRVVLSDYETVENGEFMGRKLEKGASVPQIADIINGLSSVPVGGLFAPMGSEFVEYLQAYSPAFLHCGNSFAEKRQLLSGVINIPRYYEIKENQPKPLALASGNEHEIRVASYDFGIVRDEHLMPQFEGENFSPITAITSSAVALGEIVRGIMGIGEPLDEVLRWNLWSRRRLSHVNDFDWSSFNPKGKRIQVIGAGAIGAMYHEAIDFLGFEKVWNSDFDTIDLTNCARAPHFVGHEGELKTHALARHFNARQGATCYEGKNERFDEQSRAHQVDLIVCAVDGYENQMRIVNYSQRNQIPLLLGGCTPFSASIFPYVPGKTSSILYQYDLLKQAYLSEIRQEHHHCTDPDVEGSNVLTTALCAAVLAGETVNFFCGEPLTSSFHYDMLRNPKMSYRSSSIIEDLGTDIPEFVPIPKEDVQRTIDDDLREVVLVRGEPFETWYNCEGNVLGVENDR